MERRDDYSTAYPPEGHEGTTSNEGSSHNLAMGYHRSSSSSSTASSGKHLVRSQRPSHSRGHGDGFYGRLERGYNLREERFFHHYPHHHHIGGSRHDGLSSSSPSPSPEVHKKPPKFYIGPPSTPGSSRGYHSPLR